MRLEYLNYFAAVVEYGSISKAATAIYISPQGLSQAIQQLERELNVQLFYRQGSRLTLTKAGEEVYHTASKITGLAQALRQRIGAVQADPQQSKANEITILSSPIINATILSRVLPLFHKRMPHVSVRIYEIPPENIIEAHLKNPLSILILGVPAPELTRMIKDKPTSLDFFELYRCPILCASSTVSAFCERKVISFEEFSRHPLIIYHNEEHLLDHLTLPYDPQGILMRSCSLPLCRTMLAQTPNAVGFSNQLMEHYFKNPSIFTIPLEPIYDLIYGYFLTPCCAENAAYQELIRLMEAETQKI